MSKIIFGFFLLFYTTCQAQSSITKPDYSVSIPPHWQSLSNERLTKLSKPSAKDLKNYLIGYGKHDSFAVKQPFFIINYISIPEIKAGTFQEAINSQLNTLNKFNSVKQILKDSNTSKFAYEVHSNREKLYLGYALGAEGFTCLSFVAGTESPAVNQSEFLTVLNSIHLYKKFTSKKNNLTETNKHLRLSGRYNIFLFIALLLFTIFSFFKRKRSKSGKPS